MQYRFVTITSNYTLELLNISYKVSVNNTMGKLKAI